MKEFIISEPHVQYEKLTEKDTYLIIACDGVNLYNDIYRIHLVIVYIHLHSFGML
jgi:hypothetical protein